MKPKPIFAKAHVVTGLSPKKPVQCTLDEWHEPHGALQSVTEIDPQYPGVLKHVRLGASGLQIIRGDIAVCIPLEEFFALAAAINPAFNAKPNKNLPASALAALAPAIVTEPDTAA